MKNIYSFLLLLITLATNAQVFKRSELPTTLTTPWEITYGPDGFLWISEDGGTVSRVDPSNGNKTKVYTAPDYFAGSVLEQSPLCFKPVIGAGTLGLALHPDFMDTASSYIYYVYSYNSGSTQAPATKFKLKRLKWDAAAKSVVADSDLVTMISSGYDHLGGRLMAIKQNNISHIFLSIGDHGASETNSPDCYSPQSANPNNFAQDPNTQNGKIHRFNMDGSIPSDNPISGNSFYTRGHRNPQGLMYNPNLDIIYDIEHGDRTDDEINILHKGMNYGWKYVRGYHADNNYPGEANYIKNYVPDKNIANDSLVEAFYSFCATPQDTAANYLDWCTVAPSDGLYYGSAGIPAWTNSLLLVTLKDGASTDMQVYQFKLRSDGKLDSSTASNPNPKKYFAADQKQNGRLRDIAVSPDGKKIYLINNFGANKDKITVYAYDSLASGLADIVIADDINIYPNPANDVLKINVSDNDIRIQKIVIYNMLGQVINIENKNNLSINISNFFKGFYTIEIITNNGSCAKKFLKE